VERLAFVGCLLFSILLLLLPDAAQVRVAEGLGSLLTRPFYRLQDWIEDVGRVRRQNAELRARIAALELERGEAARLRRDADRLRAALSLQQAAEGALTPCEVVARRSGRMPTRIRIHSETPVAWALYQPVVAPTGLLGRVWQFTGAHDAWVELLTSPDLAIGCEIERNGVLGILRSREGDFELAMVARDDDVREGDRVLTSGIGEVRDAPAGDRAQAAFPRGLPVGVVSAVASPADQLFKTIAVRPLASFTHNDVVFVITKPGTWYLPALAPAPADTTAAGADSSAAGRTGSASSPSAAAPVVREPAPGARPQQGAVR
jgi:cell shape-determining protein MreC